MSLTRNVLTLGLGTAVSRVLGFARDVLIAGILGAGPVADAFVVAFRLPNLFRRLFAEGAFSSAFVPLFSRELAKDGETGALKFANEAWAFLLAALLVFTVIAEIFMPQLVLLMAPGFAGNPEKFALTVLLTRICFPYLLCMSLLSLLAGILNAKGYFKASAFAPTALNLILSAAALLAWFLGYVPEKAGLALVISILVAGFVQLGILAIAAKRAGLLPTNFRPRITPNIKRLLKFGAPSVLSAGMTQINIIVGTMLASSIAGAVSYLYYADRLYQLPLGIVATAIGTALLPPISSHMAKGEWAQANELQNQGLFLTLLITLPATVALCVIPYELCAVLFERGAFSANDAKETGRVLAAYALGLPGFVLIKVLSPSFYARENAKTPFYYAAISMVVNVVASLLLLPIMGAAGIALATSIAGWGNALMLGAHLLVKKDWQPAAKLLKQSVLCVLSSGLMGAAIYYALPYARPFLLASNADMQKLIGLGSIVGLGVVVYCVLTFVFIGLKPKDILALLRKKRK